LAPGVGACLGAVPTSPFVDGRDTRESFLLCVKAAWLSDQFAGAASQLIGIKLLARWHLSN
jgi:hypothetical protein